MSDSPKQCPSCGGNCGGGEGKPCNYGREKALVEKCVEAADAYLYEKDKGNGVHPHFYNIKHAIRSVLKDVKGDL